MSRPQSPPPKIGQAAAAMLAGSVPIPEPPKQLVARRVAMFGKGIDTRLSSLMLNLKLHPTPEDEWLFSEACKVALRSNDTAFFQHAARITATLSKSNNLRLFVFIAGKVNKETPLAVITEKVNKWLESMGEKPVGIDSVRNEMGAMGLKYRAGRNCK
jgi:hypothetical protein